MLDEKFIEEFDFSNFFYYLIGIALFVGPWLMTDSFWNNYTGMSMSIIIIFNIFGYLFLLAYFLHLFKYIDKHAVITSLKKLLFMFITVFIINAMLLVFSGRLTFENSSMEFFRSIMAMQFVCSIGALFVEMLLKRK